MTESYTWQDVMALCKEARCYRDLEVRSAILADLVAAIDYIDKLTDEDLLESAFRKVNQRRRDWQDRVSGCAAGKRCSPTQHHPDCPEWRLPY